MNPSASSRNGSRGWSWEVFLSFRGEDTRFTFTDHLHSALVQNGIRTFRDDEGLDRGEEIRSSLLKAIEESRVSIVVFSRTYAHSKWCLDELTKIMECQAQKGQTVVPVFYHVDLSDVRKQTGSFGDAFAGYENVPQEKVRSWRAVLKGAADLSGWHVQDGYENQAIQKIVRNILSWNLKLLPSGDKLVGMEVRLKEMASLISTISNDVRLIGIYGIDGIGKTTLAKAVYNLIVHQFDGACFLLDVESGKKDLLELQKQLLRDILGYTIPTIRDIYEGADKIKRSLRFRKVLIVVDDVCDDRQLEVILEDCNTFGKGSTIIVTTSDRHLLPRHRVDLIYEVKELNGKEATQLFSLHAFGMNSPPKGFISLSRCMVDYCKGIPVALEVLGALLFRKEKSEWECVLQMLEKRPNMKIQNVLMRGFHRLDYNEKAIFLDVACFFKGQNLDFVLEILDTCSFFATVGMRVLAERSLISILNRKLLMHDLIQRAGWEIVRQEHPLEPGQRSRLWDPKDVYHVLTTNTGTENIEGIFFDTSVSEEIHLTTKAFKKMRRLRLLRVYQNLENNSLISNTIHLPQDFEFPSYELRYLHWEGWTLESLPSNFDGRQLVELSLKHSNIKQLFCHEMQHQRLGRLKVIDLSNSQHLIECPNLYGAPHVEKLILDGCTSLPKVHPSVTMLRRLTILRMRNCKMLHHFPDISELESLELLNLSGCSKLDKFPEIQGRMKYLLELNLDGTAIVELPSSVMFLPSLVLLDMKNCKNLMSLPSNICSLKSLETLVLTSCSELEKFPEIMEVMGSLQKLLLDGTSIKELPLSISNLNNLQILNLTKCKNLGSLPDSICSLKSLETLLVSGCSKLSKLPENLGRLQFLRNLQADGTAITQPPPSLVNLRNLKELSFKGCKGSTFYSWISSGLFGSLLRGNSDGTSLQLRYLSGLYSLKYLDLSSCSLTNGSINDKLCHLSLLEVLNLSRNNFVTVPKEVNELSNLRELYVNQCKSLKEISKLPPSVRLLDAGDCISLESLSVIPLQSPQHPSSSSCLRPATFKLPNCSALAQDNVATILEKIQQSFLPEIEYNIVLPGSTIPGWFRHLGIGSSVTIDLPQNWHNEDFLGFALCCVFSLEGEEIIRGPGQICCNFEFIEGPYLSSSISWTHSGGRVVETDHIWLVYQPAPKLKITIPSSLNKFRKITAYFNLSGESHVMRNCGIHLIYARDQKVKQQTSWYSNAKRRSDESGYSILEETQPKRRREL